MEPPRLISAAPSQRELVDRVFQPSFQSRMELVAHELESKVMDVVAHMQYEDEFAGRLNSGQYRKIQSQNTNVERAKALLTVVWNCQNDDTKLRFLYGVFAVCPSVLNKIDVDLEDAISSIMIEEAAKAGKFLDRCRPLRERLNTALETMPEQSLTLLVIGRTGVGKSSLVNSLLGKNVAREVYSAARGTTAVDCHVAELNKMKVRVWDTPGLWDYEIQDAEDDNFQADRSAHYLIEMQRVGTVDLLLLCVDSLHSVVKEDADTIAVIKAAFGREIWRHAVFVFTKANMIRDPDPVNSDDARHMKSIVNKLTREYRSILQQYGGLSKEEAAEISCVPVGSSRDMVLPNGCPWLPELWVTAAERTRQGAGKAVLIEWNRERATAASRYGESFDEDFGSQGGITVPKEVIELTQEQIRRMVRVISKVPTTTEKKEKPEVTGTAIGTLIGTVGGVIVCYIAGAATAGSVIGAVAFGSCGAFLGYVAAKNIKKRHTFVN
eukprot:m.23591 g.23591  ORF g.23591 m.23591 type:complete len:495 (+) comp28504_c0_seq1:2300-3784(+)